MDVGVLFEAARGRECFPALRTSMASGANMIGPYVPLQIAWIGENLVAILAGEPPELSVNHLMPEQVRPPCERLRTVVTGVLASGMAVSVHHVLVEVIEVVEHLLALDALHAVVVVLGLVGLRQALARG